MQLVTSDVSLLHHSSLNFSAFQQYGISSSASPPEPPKKEHENAAQSTGEEPARPSGLQILEGLKLPIKQKNQVLTQVSKVQRLNLIKEEELLNGLYFLIQIRVQILIPRVMVTYQWLI